MNIDSIKSYPAFAETKVKHRQRNYSVPDCSRKNYAEECGDKNEKTNRGYQSDSHTGIKNGAVTFGSAVNAVERKLGRGAKAVAAAAGGTPPENPTGWLGKFFKLCAGSSVIAQNLVALGLAAGPRPLAIMLLPGIKDMDDKYYASGHAIASGLIGFCFSCLVMSPLDIAAKKAKAVLKQAKDFNSANLSEKAVKSLKEAFNVKNLADLEKSKAFRITTKFVDMAPDVFLFGMLKAILTIKLIKPILKYGFGLEKKEKNQNQNNAAEKTVNQNEVSNFASMKSILKPEIQKFAGGLK